MDMGLYKELINLLEIKQGDKIWISSSLLGFVLEWRKHGEKFDTSKLIEEFINAVGENGTILIPTFSFEFSNNGFYDYKKTKGIVGNLGNVALERKEFIRTTHPLHSFAVYGKDREKLVNMDNKNSFGSDSPFGYCLEEKVKQIILGTDYVHAMTFVHYAEFMCNVPYRFKKQFKGKYIDDNGIESIRCYDYMARKLEVATVEKFNRIGKVLEDNGMSKKYNFYGVPCYCIDLAGSYPIICNDIKYNQCKNIYDFENADRSKLFENIF